MGVTGREGTKCVLDLEFWQGLDGHSNFLVILFILFPAFSLCSFRTQDLLSLLRLEYVFINRGNHHFISRFCKDELGTT